MRLLRTVTTVTVAVALTIATLLSVAPAPPSQAQTTQPWSVHRARVWRGGWSSECGSDYCGIVVLPLVRIPAERIPDGADVLVQVTLDIKTSKGASAIIHAGLFGPEQGPVPLRPSGFPVVSPKRSTVTLQWSARDVKASPEGYTVELSPTPRFAKGRSPDEIRVTGRKATVHVVVTP
jgi:hypothetical protein